MVLSATHRRWRKRGTEIWRCYVYVGFLVSINIWGSSSASCPSLSPPSCQAPAWYMSKCARHRTVHGWSHLATLLGSICILQMRKRRLGDELFPVSQLVNGNEELQPWVCLSLKPKFFPMCSVPHWFSWGAGTSSQTTAPGPASSSQAGLYTPEVLLCVCFRCWWNLV